MSDTDAVAITVTAVNDAPSFVVGANQTVAEDAGPQSVPNWATAVSAGPADESGQTLTFLATSDNTALFSVQPAVAPDGTLTFTPAADANGTATVTHRADGRRRHERRRRGHEHGDVVHDRGDSGERRAVLHRRRQPDGGGRRRPADRSGLGDGHQRRARG